MIDTEDTRTASDAQTNANRENAKKSTGPKTDAGKTASSRNSFKHGLTGSQHMLPGDDEEEFLFLFNDHVIRFHPEGPAEEKLVHRIAAGQWRLDRIFAMESGILRDRFHDVACKDAFRQQIYEYKKQDAKQDGKPEPPPPEPPLEEDLIGRAFNADCERANALSKLARYETSIERSIDRCIHQLKIFQEARQTPHPSHQPDQEPVSAPPEAPAAGPEIAPEPPPAPSKTASCETKPKNAGTPVRPPNFAPDSPIQPSSAPSSSAPESRRSQAGAQSDDLSSQ